MVRSIFDIYHPSVAATYFVAALVLSMACLQPVFIFISLIGAYAYNVCIRGWKAALKTAAWQLPLLIFIAVLNPFITQAGSTVLFRYFGHRAFYLEALVYGFCMGAMLISVMLWFSNLSHVLTSDKMMQLTGRALPTLGLMMTMIMRLVPQFVRRGREVMATQNACTAASAALEGPGETGAKKGYFATKADSMRSLFRVSSVLMGWGMEDSLDTAESMRTRGWGAVQKRSTYERSDFRATDGLLIAVLLVLLALTIALAIMACASFEFYPRMSAIAAWRHYIPYAVLLAFPLFLKIKERLTWQR